MNTLKCLTFLLSQFFKWMFLFCFIYQIFWNTQNSQIWKLFEMITAITKIYINKCNTFLCGTHNVLPFEYSQLVQYNMIAFAGCTERGQFPMKSAQVMIWLLTHQTKVLNFRECNSLQWLYALLELPNFLFIKLSMRWASKVMRSNSFILQTVLYIFRKFMIVFKLFQNKAIEKDWQISQFQLHV